MWCDNLDGRQTGWKNANSQLVQEKGARNPLVPNIAHSICGAKMRQTRLGF